MDDMFEEYRTLFAAVSVLLFFIVLISFGIGFFDTNEPATTSNEDPVLRVSTTQNSSVDDKDGDGLLDWEETIWETNRFAVDTDGDGTRDNDEVLAGRNPLIPGPNDALTSTSIAQNFADKDVLSYIEQKQTGSVEENVEVSAKTIVLSAKSDARYDNGDLTIVEDSSENKDAYKQSVTNALDPLNTITELEFTTLTLAIDGDEPEANELQRVIGIYNGVVSDFQNMHVPESAVSAHLNALNAVHEFVENFQAYQGFADNPLGLFSLVEETQDTIDSMIDAVVALHDYLGA